MNNFCYNCGAPVFQNDKFCRNCGAPLRNQTPYQTMPTEGKKVPSALAGFFKAVLVCFGFYFLYQAIAVAVCAVYEAYIIVKSGNISQFMGGDFQNDFYAVFSKHYAEVSIIAAVITLLVFALIIKLKHKKIAEEVKLKTVKVSSFAGLVIFGMSAQFFISYALELLYSTYPSVSKYSVSDDFDKLFSHANPVSEILLIAVITPLLEETLFRGIIYNRLRKVCKTVPAVVLSAVAFGAAHGNAEQFVYATLLGLVLAAAFEKCGSLWASFAIHFSFNASSYLLGFMPSKLSSAQLILVLTVSLGLMLATMALVLMSHNNTDKEEG